MRLKVLCIGDSLAMPGHNILYEDTWIVLVKNAFPHIDFIPVFQRAITTNILNLLGGGYEDDPMGPDCLGSDCLEHYMPDKVILQLGIVDCAPRYINPQAFIVKIVAKLPAIFQTIFYSMLKKIRKRSIKYAEVSKEQYQSNLKKYLDRCLRAKVKEIIIIKICTPDKRMLLKTPAILDALEDYNKIYDKLAQDYDFVKLVDPLNSKLSKIDIFVDDGYHPNVLGHKQVFESISKYVQ